MENSQTIRNPQPQPSCRYNLRGCPRQFMSEITFNLLLCLNVLCADARVVSSSGVCLQVSLDKP